MDLDWTGSFQLNPIHTLVQSAQYRTRLSEIEFLRTVLVWLSTYIPCQLNIVSDYAITQYRTNASEIAHLVHIVCSGLKCLVLTRHWHIILSASSQNIKNMT